MAFLAISFSQFFYSRNFINQVDFLVGKGLLCLYDKYKYIVFIWWLLEDTEFSSRFQLQEKFHIYSRPCIILYLWYLIRSDSGRMSTVIDHRNNESWDVDGREKLTQGNSRF